LLAGVGSHGVPCGPVGFDPDADAFGPFGDVVEVRLDLQHGEVRTSGLGSWKARGALRRSTVVHIAALPWSRPSSAAGSCMFGFDTTGNVDECGPNCSATEAIWFTVTVAS
jgi:hypothetical protein